MVLIKGVAPVLALSLAVAGCAARVPADPEGSLEDIRSTGVLRAGASPHEPWVTLPESPDRDPGGREVELVETFASELGANVQWTVAGEADLVGRMEREDLHIIVGGLTADTPYGTKLGLTRPYAESTSPEGKTLKHVLAVRMGENALLSSLEAFLDEAGA